jgi:hypothetical protein
MTKKLAVTSKRIGVAAAVGAMAIGLMATATPAQARVPGPGFGPTPSAPIPAGCAIWQTWTPVAKWRVTSKRHWFRVLLCDTHKSTEHLVLQQWPAANGG